MRHAAPTWIARNALYSCALMFALCLAGCHSTRFGPLISRSEPLAIHATLGDPTPVRDLSPIRLAVHQDEKSDPSDTRTLPDEHVQAIDLATALTRAGADNPT